jgi:carboxyl-terminal processing protease
MPRTNLSVILLVAVLSMICYQRASQTRYSATIADAMSQIDSHFVDSIQRRELFEASMNGMVKELDRYSNYIAPEDYVRLQQEIEQQFGGIGIVVDIDQETNRPVILSARPGGPAFQAGLRAGDVIVAIDGVDTGELAANGPVKLIRGEPGTPVVLSILSSNDETPRDLVILRGVISIESVMGFGRDSQSNWMYRIPDDPRIGYIWLESFGEETSHELADALDQIEPEVDALIVDVRTNAGGLLSAAVEVCDMFIPGGTIVTIRGRHSRREENGRAGNEHFSATKPLVVLADRYSASAAEIFAACMQDYGRGIVIGERTWGKGTVQSVFELEGGRSALRLTTATYWRPSGTNIHRRPDSSKEDRWGVVPNEGFEVKFDDDQYVQFMRERNRRFAGTIDSLEPDERADERAAESDMTGKVEPKAGPFVDTQLQQGIEYLQQRLEGR